MKKISLFSILSLSKGLFLIPYLSFCQVGIGTTTPHASAQLEISNTSKGLLIPRMTTTGVTSISNPAKGLMVYDTVKNQLMVNMGSSATPNWQTIVFNSGWSLSGNVGINPANQFIGTTDVSPIVFKVKNAKSGYVDSSSFNTSLGFRTLDSVTSTHNVAIGYKALFNDSSGGSNVALGANAMFSNASGSWNTAAGEESLYSNTTGYANTALGNSTLSNNTTGIYNTASGYEALFYNVSGHFNTAVGIGSLRLNLGSLAHYNTAVGAFALTYTTNSQFNTAVGYLAGGSFNMGYNNTFIGAHTAGNFTGQFNCVAVGQGTICPDNSTARFGNSATWSVGSWANWSNFSDGRFKNNVREDVKGLEFILKLRPVTYQLNVSALSEKLLEGQTGEGLRQMKTAIEEKEKMIFSGFLAQEVEDAATQVGYNFSGVDKPRIGNGHYGLRYAEFVVPLVKAVQEQHQMISALQERIQLLEEQNRKLTLILSEKK